MTREEALQHFKEQLDIFGGEHAEAIKVAIEALSAEAVPKGDDLISREAAKDIAFRSPFFSDALIEELDALPSADRQRGEWIETAQDYYETVNKKGGGVNEDTEYFTDDIACSECLTKFSNIDNETERFNFCPNCGADMRGEDK